MGVTKSLLSHIEAGKRQPTPDQIAALATMLQIPADMPFWGLAECRRTSGELLLRMLPRRLPPCANALRRTPFPILVRLRTFRCRRAKQPHSQKRCSQNASMSRKPPPRIARTAITPKVPPEVITPFIRDFTRPGDTIFDPFCGSGTTGVAALMEGRNALLSDLSPAAVHIARNYTTPCDPRAFAATLAVIENAVAPTIGWLYRAYGSDRMVEYTTWSDVYSCPASRNQIVYWDVVQRAKGTTSDHLACASCGTRSRKAGSPALVRIA
jgi:hypothetical protein